MYTHDRLREENESYAGTGGVSSNNSHARFAPAFRDEVTGRVAIARGPDGRPSSMHLFFCLPEEWVAHRNEAGDIDGLIETVVAGFVREGRFYTREEAARLT